MRAKTIIEGLNAFLACPYPYPFRRLLRRLTLFGLLLQRDALRKVHVTDGQNKRDQITRVEVETRVIKFRFVHSINPIDILDRR